jgi:hypothetical protein
MLALQRLQRPTGLARPAAKHTVLVQAVARPSTCRPAAAAGTSAATAAGGFTTGLPLGALAAAAPFLLDIPAALATSGDFGILEGRTAALVHPAVMVILFGMTGYAGFLGWQWRRTRTIGDDIKALKAQLPKPAEGEAAPPPSPVAAQVAALEKVGRVGRVGARGVQGAHAEGVPGAGRRVLGSGPLCAPRQRRVGTLDPSRRAVSAMCGPDTGRSGGLRWLSVA